MAEVIPGFTNKFDITDLVKCISQRHLLIVSAADDKYSRDADAIEDLCVIHIVDRKPAAIWSITDMKAGMRLHLKGLQILSTGSAMLQKRSGRRFL